MMEAKTFDIKKSKTELPNLPSEQNQVLVIFLILFLERIL